MVALVSTGCTGGFLAARCGLCGCGDPHDSRSGERRYNIAIRGKALRASSADWLGSRFAEAVEDFE